MAFTNTLTMTLAGDGKAVGATIAAYTGSEQGGISIQIPAGATDQEVDIVFPVADLQFVAFKTDQDLTIKVNSTSTPAPALALNKTAGIFWGNNFLYDCPLTTNVTKFYISNAGAVAANFEFRYLLT